MAISTSYPFNLQNGLSADATQVMANFLQIQNDVNANAAHSGANSDITSLSGLTTALSIAQGGTGASTSAGALTALGAAPITSPTFAGTPSAPTASPGTSTTQLATTAYALLAANSAAAAAVPTGAVFDFAVTAVPTGYLECNGAAVSRTTYAALFTAVGTNWGAGDGTTTFNVPNFQRRTRIGRGGASTAVIGNVVGNTGGEEAHVQTTAELAAHAHFVVNGTSSSSTGVSPTTSINASTVGGLGGQDYTLCSTPTPAINGLSSTAGSSTAFNVMQPSAVVLTCIKY